AGTLTEVAVDAATGAGSAGIVKGGASLLRKVLPKKVAPPASKGPVAKAGEAPQSQAIQTYWPPNRGFLRPPQRTTLAPGATLDRFGHEGGSFAAPFGTPFSLRGLPPESLSKPYNGYKVVKPIEVDAGTAAPAFGGELGPQFDMLQP